jgi:hypothetical protein
MEEKGIVSDGIVGKHYYKQTAVKEERKLMFDIDRAHNISVGLIQND